MTDIDTQISLAVLAFDRTGGGVIDDNAAVLAARSMGYNLSDKEVDSLREDIGTGKSATEATSIIKRKIHNKTAPKSEMIQIFKQFDRSGNGTISQKELTEILKTMGEILTEPEQTALCSISSRDGLISYSDLIDKLLSM